MKDKYQKRPTLQGTNISHLGKRKIIDSKVPLKGDMLVPRMLYSKSTTMFTDGMVTIHQTPSPKT